MSKNHEEQDKLMMNTMYWWGIPSFFKCNFQENIENTDIAFVGVPHSTGNGTTERDQHLGPRAVRHVSGSLRRVHMKYEFSPWEVARINDLGDVPLPEANNNEACIRDISNFYKFLINVLFEYKSSYDLINDLNVTFPPFILGAIFGSLQSQYNHI